MKLTDLVSPEEFVQASQREASLVSIKQIVPYADALIAFGLTKQIGKYEVARMLSALTIFQEALNYKNVEAEK